MVGFTFFQCYSQYVVQISAGKINIFHFLPFSFSNLPDMVWTWKLAMRITLKDEMNQWRRQDSHIFFLSFIWLRHGQHWAIIEGTPSSTRCWSLRLIYIWTEGHQEPVSGKGLWSVELAVWKRFLVCDYTAVMTLWLLLAKWPPLFTFLSGR